MTRQLIVSWIGVGGVLLLIITVNRFALYLGDAAAGRIPSSITLTLLGLNLVGLLQVVIPVSLFLASVIVLGRLYRDNEIVVATACGLTPMHTYRPFFLLCLSAMIIVATISLYAAPWAAATGHRIEVQAQRKARVSLLRPGQFKSIGDGRGVFYAGQEGTGSELNHVFTELGGPDGPTVLTGKYGYLRVGNDKQRYLQVLDGYRYSGKPGALGWTVTQFSRADILIRSAPRTRKQSQVRLDRVPTVALLRRHSPEAMASFQWRLVQPFTVLVLILIAVPLSAIRPRQGRYSRIVPAILIYVLYFNLLGIAQVWVGEGRVSKVIGLWWVPILFFLGAMVLTIRRYGLIKVRGQVPSR